MIFPQRRASYQAKVGSQALPLSGLLDDDFTAERVRLLSFRILMTASLILQPLLRLSNPDGQYNPWNSSMVQPLPLKIWFSLSIFAPYFL